MIDILRVIGRAILSLATLFFMTKLLGKKQVSQLSLFDYVIGISIGNFAAEMTVNLDSNILYGTVAVVIFGLVAYFISILTMKSIVLRRYFMDEPTVLIANGKILEKGLRHVKFDINDLIEQCRTAGYFDLSEINFAIMEGNGSISVLPKEKYKCITKNDMNIKTLEGGLVASIIIDGNIMYENLKNMGKSEKWLLKKLKDKAYDVKDVLYATVDVHDNFVIYPKNDDEYLDVLE